MTSDMYHRLCKLHATASCACECWEYNRQCETTDFCIQEAINEYLQSAFEQNTAEYEETQPPASYFSESSQQHSVSTKKKN
jgi:hypothetical protein